MLKVMTLNLNYYVAKYGPWNARRELVCHVVESARPDIIAFQATRSEPGVADGLDQAAQLSKLLPEYGHVLFQPAADMGEGVFEGSALLSRLPLGYSAYLPLILLPGLDDTNRRVLLASRVDLAGGPLYIFNAHFSWVGEQAEANLDQALPYVNSFDGQALIVGDMNNTPDSSAMRRLGNNGWTDAWARLNPGDPGLTFESGNPSIRIDYAWANPALVGKLSGIEIVANTEGQNGERPSDHFGLLVTLDLDV